MDTSNFLIVSLIFFNFSICNAMQYKRGEIVRNQNPIAVLYVDAENYNYMRIDAPDEVKKVINQK